jgi:hypothetical protein
MMEGEDNPFVLPGGKGGPRPPPRHEEYPVRNMKDNDSQRAAFEIPRVEAPAGRTRVLLHVFVCGMCRVCFRNPFHSGMETTLFFIIRHGYARGVSKGAKRSTCVMRPSWGCGAWCRLRGARWTKAVRGFEHEPGAAPVATRLFRNAAWSYAARCAEAHGIPLPGHQRWAFHGWKDLDQVNRAGERPCAIPLRSRSGPCRLAQACGFAS